jgi:hypothetical protein
LVGGHPFAPLDLAHLTLRRGKRKQLAHLKEHLSWLVQRGRDTCAGEVDVDVIDAPMQEQVSNMDILVAVQRPHSHRLRARNRLVSWEGGRVKRLMPNLLRNKQQR